MAKVPPADSREVPRPGSQPCVECKGLFRATQGDAKEDGLKESLPALRSSPGEGTEASEPIQGLLWLGLKVTPTFSRLDMGLHLGLAPDLAPTGEESQEGFFFVSEQVEERIDI